MQCSLSWIEWLDRLDRDLEEARRDVRRLARMSSPKALAAVERSKRQLAALASEFKILDRGVLASKPGSKEPDPAENLQRALDTTVFQLGMAANMQPAIAYPPRERLLAAVDAALRDSNQAAALLLGPSISQSMNPSTGSKITTTVHSTL